jgi:hypothetical protein
LDLNSNILFSADPLYVGIEIKIAEINDFSEVNMVSLMLKLELNQLINLNEIAGLHSNNILKPVLEG